MRKRSGQRYISTKEARWLGGHKKKRINVLDPSFGQFTNRGLEVEGSAIGVIGSSYSIGPL